ncbi:MAG TPA: hypothetical protein ENK19_08160, partial [Acidobacteria bacterium]|nr:hypothetical protein [Acidobacteriota bacterium]
MGVVMRWRSWRVVVIGVMAALGAGCGHERGQAPSKAGKALPEAVAAHSSGVIPAEGPIRVRFVDPVVDGSKVGSPASSSVFRISPHVAGEAIWTGTRDLEFRPSEPLTPGTTYDVTVSVRPAGGGKTLRFGFEVRAADQVMEIGVDGLTVERDGGARLTGRLTTSNAAKAEAVEKVV